MNGEDMTHRFDDSPDRPPSPPAPGNAADSLHPASSKPSPLALIDAVAAGTLSRRALTRYEAYRQVLRAREQNEEAIVSTLTLFVWDLYQSR